MHYPGAGWIRISASQSSNKYKQQESLANAEVNARQPWLTQFTKSAPISDRVYSNINVIYASLESTFSVQQFPR